jgi:hypothetical protein
MLGARKRPGNGLRNPLVPRSGCEFQVFGSVTNSTSGPPGNLPRAGGRNQAVAGLQLRRVLEKSLSQTDPKPGLEMLGAQPLRCPQVNFPAFHVAKGTPATPEGWNLQSFGLCSKEPTLEGRRGQVDGRN